MTVAAPTPTTDAVSQATSTVNAGIGSLANSYTTFLSLLTAQLQNQDPLSPMDNNAFTQQLTSMTGVQQQLLTNQLLTQLLGQNQANLGSGAVNLVGKSVTVDSNQAQLTDKGASWSYDLAGPAASTKLEVVDGNGQTVWTGLATSNGQGTNSFSWNGKTLSGGALPLNVPYTLNVTAVDASGAPITSTGHLTGIASGVETVGGTTMISINGVDTPLTAVTGVQSAPS